MIGRIYNRSDRPRFIKDTIKYRDYANGYVYMIKVGEVVKIGKSVDPNSRLKSHFDALSTFNQSADCYWVSPHHAGYGANEDHLIQKAAEIGTPARRGKESFTASFDALVEHAQSLTYELHATPQQKAAARRAKRPVRELVTEQLGSRSERARRGPGSSSAEERMAHFLLRGDAEESALLVPNTDLLDSWYEEVTAKLLENYQAIRPLVAELQEMDNEPEGQVAA